MVEVDPRTEATLRLLAAAAGPYSHAFDWLGDVPDDEAWNLIIQQATGESMMGLLAEHSVARWSLSPFQLDRLRTAHHRVMARQVRLERMLIDVVEYLRAVGDVELIVLKGVALAHTAYSSPELRPSSDADVLVPNDRFVEALQLLVSNGAQRVLPERRRGFDERFAKDVPLWIDGLPLDLHRTLAVGAIGDRLPLRRMEQRSRLTWVAGTALRVLAREDQLLHAAVTAGASDIPPRSATLRDLVELLAAGDLGEDSVIAEAIVWQCEAVLAKAVHLANEWLQLDSPVLIGRRVSTRPSVHQRAMLYAYSNKWRKTTRQLTSLTTRTPADAVRLLIGLARPSREYRSVRASPRELPTGRPAVDSSELG